MSNISKNERFPYHTAMSTVGEFLVLACIYKNRKDVSSVQLIEELRQIVKGVGGPDDWKPLSGYYYEMLDRLEDEGWIKAIGSGTKKRFEVVTDRRHAFAEYLSTYQDLFFNTSEYLGECVGGSNG